MYRESAGAVAEIIPKRDKHDVNEREKRGERESGNSIHCNPRPLLLHPMPPAALSVSFTSGYPYVCFAVCVLPTLTCAFQVDRPYTHEQRAGGEREKAVNQSEQAIGTEKEEEGSDFSPSRKKTTR